LLGAAREISILSCLVTVIGHYLIKIVFLLLILFIFFLFMRYLEKKNLYFPLRDIEATPEDINLSYENIAFMTSDNVRLTGWFIPSSNPHATMILFHGNGGNISHRLEKINILSRLDVNILIFDYRGYGESAGSPSEEGLYRDADAAYDYLVKVKNILPEDIIAYGESLGGSVTVDLAARHKVRGMILEGSFTSVRDMARRYFPFIPSFLYQSKYDSLTKIKGILAPKLIFHSVDDEIIPPDLGKKLFNAAAGPKEFVALQGGHNDAFLVSQDTYKAEIEAFIKGHN
jgi:fermentation-respiration switch protein FrsA (DUF1100 family)